LVLQIKLPFWENECFVAITDADAAFDYLSI
jgi:hypothetical protein